MPLLDGNGGGDSEERLLPLGRAAAGHDSRAPVFEYNALYCPRHIIYLAVK